MAGYGIRINASESLSQKIFFSRPFSRITRDQIVLFSHPHMDGSIAKIVFGLPGDLIEVRDDHVFVGGRDAGRIKAISSSGKTYLPIAEKIIPAEYYFVLGTHEESYDSRYQAFGLVHSSWIKEELWAIF